jgi:hypothetical protein
LSYSHELICVRFSACHSLSIPADGADSEFKSWGLDLGSFEGGRGQ